MAEELINKEPEFQVTARKWRPRNFDDVTSQDFITKTLRNAVKNNRISHAYLFSGPRGVGKTTVARLLAKSLNCNNRNANGEPCNKCDSCKEINNDNRNHPDVFEIDGASNRNIEDVRELKEKVKYGPVRSKYKIFIIDEVHMLTGASFNALLKTLEEPPAYVVFIFATTVPEKVPLTILGRCQKFDFKRLTIEEISLRLKFIAENEKIKVDKESLFFISKKGDGSMRDAQGLFDMSAAYCDNKITFEKLKSFFNLTESDVYFEITDLIKARDAKGLLNYFDSLMDKGYDMQIFLEGLTEHYRNLLVACSTGSSELIIESEAVKQSYTENISKFTQLEILNSLKLILQTEYIFKYSSNQRTLIEALLVEMIKFTDTRDISQLIDELKELKSGNYSESTAIKSGSAEKKASSKTNETQIKVNYSSKKIDTDEKTSSVNKPETTNDELQSNETTNINIETVDLNSHWISIKDQIKTERKWVYSIIKDTTFEKDDNENLLIRVDDTTYELIDGYRDYLTGKISKYFGQSLTIGLVKSSEFISSSSGNDYFQPSESQSVLENETPQANNFDKIRNILLKDFNAKEIIHK
ncbi:MAG: DNA polymerase III subunit gamma/tau [Ignavibacteria bacterium]|nr:DNA polymerase III subunit gamma/tau [Ignavibacteria bacterium]